jgi:hypothetical protein
VERGNWWGSRSVGSRGIQKRSRKRVFFFVCAGGFLVFVVRRFRRKGTG